ncbi:M repeat-like protein isoform 2 [Schistosoma japonicum]|nr:M repeat-like protein isoform 2 [Schistosoma japonicum]
MKHLGNEVLQLRNAIIEKDKMLTELHAYLKESRQNVESMKLQCENAESKRNDAEKRYEEIKDKLTNKDQELKSLRKRMEEAVSMNSTSNILTTTISNNRDSTQQDSSHTNRDLMLNRRGFEVDKLRRELSLTKREKDDLYIELKKLRCKLDKRHTSEERGRKDITGYLTNLNMGNTYAKAISAQQPTTKITLLNEHIGILNRANAELKIQNESLHNSVIDYQRRYRSIKEQYEGEQEAWITERLVLESKAKEQEDRRTTITNTRKLLQDTSVKLFDLEKESEKKLTNLQTAYEKLEKEKQTIELKLAQLEDTQKLPKVLQRFNASSSSSIRPSVLTSQARTAQLENQEIILKLQNAERIISKLRSELIEMKELHATQSIAAVQEAEEARLSMERELEDIKDRLLTMECYRQQVELFRHRHFELEETAEKEYKIWQEERDHLIYQAEAARVMIDQWSTQIKCKVNSEDNKLEEILNEILKSMEKWSTEHERLPNLKRRMLDSVSSIESTSGIGLSTGATNSPLITQSPKGGLMISSTISPFSPNLLAKGSTLTAQRSTSMEWTSSRFHGPSSGHSFGLNFRENSIGLGGATISGTSLIGGFRGSALSLATNTGVGGGSNYSLMVNSRCGRSVSPEVTVKKISNYPDPTLGFLVRPTSRQGSQDSLASITDYSQRSFTLPGKPPIRSIISPARRMFFEENRENKSSEIDIHHTTQHTNYQNTHNESIKTSQISLGYPEEKNNMNSCSLTPTTNSTTTTTNTTHKHTTDLSQKADDKSKSLKSNKSTNSHIATNKQNNSTNHTKLTDEIDKSSGNSSSTHSRLSFTNRFTRWSNSSSNKHLEKAHSVEPNSLNDYNENTVDNNIHNETIHNNNNNTSNTTDKIISKSRENLFTRTTKKDKIHHKTNSQEKSKGKSPELEKSVKNNIPQISDTSTSTTMSTTSTSSIGHETSSQLNQSIVKRSKSVTNISPAIMALRQKFSGGGKT